MTVPRPSLYLGRYVLLIAAGFLPGCGSSGPPRVEISGNVTVDDASLESGTIAFIPKEGVEGPSAGGEIKDGSYRITSADGPTVGPHIVEIRAWRGAGENVVTGIGGSATGPSGAVTAPKLEMYIPSEYNTKTTLSVTVEAGSNQHDFSIKTATP